MEQYKYVTMDKSRKIYIPATLENDFKGKEFTIISMPDGDIILHPIVKNKDPFQSFKKAGGQLKKSLREAKKDILDAAMEGV